MKKNAHWDNEADLAHGSGAARLRRLAVKYNVSPLAIAYAKNKLGITQYKTPGRHPFLKRTYTLQTDPAVADPAVSHEKLAEKWHVSALAVVELRALRPKEISAFKRKLRDSAAKKERSVARQQAFKVIPIWLRDASVVDFNMPTHIARRKAGLADYDVRFLREALKPMVEFAKKNSSGPGPWLAFELLESVGLKSDNQIAEYFGIPAAAVTDAREAKSNFSEADFRVLQAAADPSWRTRPGLLKLYKVTDEAAVDEVRENLYNMINITAPAKDGA